MPTSKDVISNDRVVKVGSRFFICSGRAGFSLPANKARGYATAKAAEKASLVCEPSDISMSEFFGWNLRTPQTRGND